MIRTVANKLYELDFDPIAGSRYVFMTGYPSGLPELWLPGMTEPVIIPAGCHVTVEFHAPKDKDKGGPCRIVAFLVKPL